MSDQTPDPIIHIAGPNVRVVGHQVQRCMVCGALLAHSTDSAMAPALVNAEGRVIGGHVVYPELQPIRFRRQGDTDIVAEAVRAPLAECPEFCGHALNRVPEPVLPPEVGP